MPDGTTLAYGRFIIIKSVPDDRGSVWVNGKALFFIHDVTKRTVTGNNSAVLHLTVKHNRDSFTAYISFILGD